MAEERLICQARRTRSSFTSDFFSDLRFYIVLLSSDDEDSKPVANSSGSSSSKKNSSDRGESVSAHSIEVLKFTRACFFSTIQRRDLDDDDDDFEAPRAKHADLSSYRIPRKTTTQRTPEPSSQDATTTTTTSRTPTPTQEERIEATTIEAAAFLVGSMKLEPVHILTVSEDVVTV